MSFVGLKEDLSSSLSRMTDTTLATSSIASKKSWWLKTRWMLAAILLVVDDSISSLSPLTELVNWKTSAPEGSLLQLTTLAATS